MNTKSRLPGSVHRFAPWSVLVVAAAGTFLLGELQFMPWLLAFACIWLLGRLLRMHDLGIMGGAFNPIHNSHLAAADCAIEQFDLDKVLFVPSGNPPHKKDRLLDKELRFEMVAAAVQDSPRCEASRLEVDRPGVTWTIDTLKELRKRCGWRYGWQYGFRVRLNFIIGEDNIATIQNYDRKDELLGLCRLLVCPRVAADRKTHEEWRRALPGADLEVLDFTANELSSTLVRQLVAAGKSIRNLVPEAVRIIIQTRGLYKASSETSKSSDHNAA